QWRVAVTDVIDNVAHVFELVGMVPHFYRYGLNGPRRTFTPEKIHNQAERCCESLGGSIPFIGLRALSDYLSFACEPVRAANFGPKHRTSGIASDGFIN